MDTLLKEIVPKKHKRAAREEEEEEEEEVSDSETATDDESEEEEEGGDDGSDSDVESEGDGCVSDKTFTVLCKTAARAIKNLKGDLVKSVSAAVNTVQAQSDLKAIRVDVKSIGHKLCDRLVVDGAPLNVLTLVNFILDSSTVGPVAWRECPPGVSHPCVFDPAAKANIEVQIPADALGVYAHKFGRSADAPPFDEWSSRSKVVRSVFIHKSKLVDLLALTQFASFRLLTAPVYTNCTPKESAALYAATVKRVTRMI